LNRNVPLTVANNSETPIAQLHKGETVNYLGVVAGDSRRSCGLLVQTKNGERGLISAVAMGYSMFFTDS